MCLGRTNGVSPLTPPLFNKKLSPHVNTRTVPLTCICSVLFLSKCERCPVEVALRVLTTPNEFFLFILKSLSCFGVGRHLDLSSSLPLVPVWRHSPTWRQVVASTRPAVSQGATSDVFNMNLRRNALKPYDLLMLNKHHNDKSITLSKRSNAWPFCFLCKC